ncbi:MAG: flagellar biosynthesis protein FliQ [Actinobacteria bacterium]|nr:flagellar biosynthesis protein FliQ [Actinomycetota bacterium]
MTNTTVLTMASQALTLIGELAGPALIVSLVVGFIIAVFQAVTSIQEFTLTFLPKVAAIAIIMLVLGHWMLGDLVSYTQHLYNSIPQVIAGK